MVSKILKMDILPLECSFKGNTIVPLQLYFNRKNYANIQIAIAHGKKLHDKRADMKCDIERELKGY